MLEALGNESVHPFLHISLASDPGLLFAFTSAIRDDGMIQKAFVSKGIELMCSLVWLWDIRKPRKCSGKWTT